jgi:L-malate glycosyltransferase
VNTDTANVGSVNADQARPLRILHCHSTFSLGGKEARAVRLMNVFGDRAQHTILSAVPDALGARDAIDPGIVTGPLPGIVAVHAGL